VAQPSAPASSLRPGRLLLGILIGLMAHALPFGAGFLATRIVKPSPGGGFEDLGAFVVAFFGTELLIALASLITGIVLVARGRRDTGLGLIIGWLVGAVAVGVLSRIG